MSFSEDIFEMRKILKKQAILKPATKAVKKVSVNEVSPLFKPATDADVSTRPLLPVWYHIFSWQDDKNSTDEYTEDYTAAVKMAKRLVRDGWDEVRIEATDDEEDSDGDMVWIGGVCMNFDNEPRIDVDYSREQAEADVARGIDEALAESEKALRRE